MNHSQMHLFALLSLLFAFFSVVHSRPTRPVDGHDVQFDDPSSIKEEWNAFTASIGSKFASALAHHHTRHHHHHLQFSSTAKVALSSSSASTTATSDDNKAAPTSSESVLKSSSTSSASASANPTEAPKHPISSSSVHSSSSSSASAPSSSAPAATSAPGYSPFQLSYLDPQNAIRATKGAPSLQWNNTLATFAKNWASNCVFQHSDSPYGENVAAGTGSFASAAAGVKLWTDEESSYDSLKPMPSHYTQVVWKSSTQVGCSVAVCNDLLGKGTGVANFHVCEYYPAGNVIGQFPANVEA